MPSKACSIILYHTDACHLCELAAGLLQQTQVTFVAQDICDNDKLAEVYGTRIPVIKKTGCNSELNWPFDLEALEEFLGA
ncbi:glutaredoxin family protein [Shewanella gelidimarina]|uniref:glutaredoxin family protein n=1 Tax=Shewanella gelidimarina TaxID=56813 RepID=UPI00200DDD40|nr:glutaredoxin family protein [Shewanella gelidimarina]MCL1058164.1 glutaredoxin family protein [Shewanella gelidimarina]